jgi:hypothetical protein
LGVIIPLYNLDLLLKIAGRPGWWLILFLVPIVNFVIIVIVWLNLADFNAEDKLGRDQEMQDRLSKLVAIFDSLDFRSNRASGDDLLSDAYEYLMRHFATESGKSKGQFYTPAEVSRTFVTGIDVTLSS